MRPLAPRFVLITARYLSALIALVLLVGVDQVLDGRAPAPSMADARPVAAPVVRSALEPERSALPAPAAAPRPRLTPAPKAARAAKPRREVIHRWLPSGTGMWLHEWDKSEGGSARRVVARAKQAGITTIYVRGWSKKGGWEAPAVLRQLLPATKGTGIRVVVWEFAYLADPAAEARRLAAAARIRVAGAPAVAAVAPDIETAAEGTALNSKRVRAYMAALRKALPPEVSILGTVPWPSEHRVGSYPYSAVAGRSDALLPMTYWYNRSPQAVTKYSLQWLRKFKRPVMPVGQGYDPRMDAPYLPAYNVPAQVGSFLTTAREAKAPAVSLWSWQTASGQVWSRLSGARRSFPHKAVGPKVVVQVPPGGVRG